MLRQQKIDNMAVIGISLLGLIFFIVACVAFKNIDVSCPSSIIRDGWTVILVLGACMLVAGISFFGCTLMSGDKCYKDSTSIRTLDTYFGIFILFGSFIIGICSAMLNKYSKMSATDLANCDNGTTNKNYTIMILVFAILIVLFSGGVLARLHIEDIVPEKPSGPSPGLEGIL